MSQKNPWKTKSSRYVYQNDWIRVREDSVIRPDGNDGIYGVVETRVATAVLALTDNDEVYLVGQYRYPTNVYSWEIIEGGTDDNETPLAAAKRELQEEAGLVAESWIQLGGEIHLSNCHSSEVAVIYVAKGLQQVAAAPDGTEVLQIKKLPFKEAYAQVIDGTITDSLTIIALHRAVALGIVSA